MIFSEEKVNPREKRSARIFRGQTFGTWAARVKLNTKYLFHFLSFAPSGGIGIRTPVRAYSWFSIQRVMRFTAPS